MDGGVEDTILVGDRVVLYCNIKLSGVMKSEVLSIIDLAMHQVTSPFWWKFSILFLWILW